MKKFIYSLKFKILISVVVILLLGHFVGTVIWVQSTIAQTKKTMENNFAASLNVANQNFEKSMKDIERICAFASSSVGESSSVRNYLHIMNPESGADAREKLEAGRSVKEFLLNLCRFQYYLTGVAVNDLKGHQQTYGIIMSDAELCEQEWLQEFLKKTEDTMIVPPHDSFPGKSNDTMVFSVVRKIKRREELQGIIIADISYQMLKDFYYLEDLLEYPVFVTTGEEEQCIFPDQEYFLPKDKQAIVMEMKMPITDWTVHGVIPKQSIVTGCMTVLKGIIFSTLMLNILLFAVIGVVIHLMTKELTVLADAVKNVSGNHMELGVSIKAKDEVGELYNQTNRMLVRIKELIVQIQKTEDEKRKLEIVALQEQINPHFLYNTLNTISYLAQLRGIQNIQSVATALSDMMHITLDSKKFITINDEVSYLKQYMEIQEYKYPGKFVLEFQVDEAAGNCLIPKMILQPLVENSLKHGIATILRPGHIQISIGIENERLIVKVWDNGNGISEELLQRINMVTEKYEQGSGNSIGIFNVKNRLALLYGERSKFMVSSVRDEYTLIELEIPVEYEVEKQV